MLSSRLSSSSHIWGKWEAGLRSCSPSPLIGTLTKKCLKTMRFCNMIETFKKFILAGRGGVELRMIVIPILSYLGSCPGSGEE
jgi:hypothetical protein